MQYTYKSVIEILSNSFPTCSIVTPGIWQVLVHSPEGYTRATSPQHPNTTTSKRFFLSLDRTRYPWGSWQIFPMQFFSLLHYHHRSCIKKMWTHPTMTVSVGSLFLCPNKMNDTGNFKSCRYMISMKTISPVIQFKLQE